MRIGRDLLIISKEKVNLFFRNHLKIAYEAIRDVYTNFALGQGQNPSSSFLWYNPKDNSRIIALPAFTGFSEERPGIKWIASCPKNIEKGLPRASALIILNDYETGFPIAIIEGSLISSLRTVLSALLALSHLNKEKEIETLGCIGCGFITQTFLSCLSQLGWRVGNYYFMDQSIARAQYLQAHLSNQSSHSTTNLKEVLSQSDVVFFATTALTPYINEKEIFKSCATLLHISLRDLSAEIILSAYNIVDDIEHVLQANTSPHLAYLKSGHKKFIAGTLVDLMAGLTTRPTNQLRIFSPMGMGILDMALANLIYSHNLKQAENEIINNFF